jgi:hypothetical protein
VAATCCCCAGDCCAASCSTLLADRGRIRPACRGPGAAAAAAADWEGGHSSPLLLCVPPLTGVLAGVAAVAAAGANRMEPLDPPDALGGLAGLCCCCCCCCGAGDRATPEGCRCGVLAAAAALVMPPAAVPPVLVPPRPRSESIWACRLRGTTATGTCCCCCCCGALPDSEGVLLGTSALVLVDSVRKVDQD